LVFYQSHVFLNWRSDLFGSSRLFSNRFASQSFLLSPKVKFIVKFSYVGGVVFFQSWFW
jgi:hypothetical protein